MASETFKNAVNKGDFLSVRIMMKDSLLVDPTFQRFEDMKKTAGAMPGLYDPDDGAELNQNPAEWTEEYMNQLMAEVLYHFSERRLAHLKEVVKKCGAYTQEEENIIHQRKQEERKQEQIKKGAVGAAAGALLGGTAGAVLAAGVAAAAAPIAVTTATIGAVTGAVIALNQKEGD